MWPAHNWQLRYRALVTCFADNTYNNSFIYHWLRQLCTNQMCSWIKNTPTIAMKTSIMQQLAAIDPARSWCWGQLVLSHSGGLYMWQHALTASHDHVWLQTAAACMVCGAGSGAVLPSVGLSGASRRRVHPQHGHRGPTITPTITSTHPSHTAPNTITQAPTPARLGVD